MKILPEIATEQNVRLRKKKDSCRWVRITDILNDVWACFKIQSQDVGHIAPHYLLLISNISKMVWTDQERPWGQSSPWTPGDAGTSSISLLPWDSVRILNLPTYSMGFWHPKNNFPISLVSQRKSMDKRKNFSLPRQIYLYPSRHGGKSSMITTKIIILPLANSTIPGGSETGKQSPLSSNIYRLLIQVQTESCYFQCPIYYFITSL